MWKKKKFFNTYTKLRMKIISEKLLLRNHLKIYNLLRSHNRRNIYQLKDLINLV